MVNQETHIRIKKVTKEKLDNQKIHPRQSYDEVIDIMVSSASVVKLAKGVKGVDNQTEVKKKR